MILKSVALAAALLASIAASAAITSASSTSAPPTEGVMVSTDPAKAAEVERHAQEIQAQQKPSMNTSGTGSKKATKHHKKTKKQAAKTAS